MEVVVNTNDSAVIGGKRSISKADAHTKTLSTIYSVEDVTTSADTSSTRTGNRPRYSALRKFALLVIFCMAQFLDAFNASALFSAIPIISQHLDILASESVWITSATQLTFSAFLLLSGRISDVHNPKYAFISGVAGLGCINLGLGFVKQKIALFTLRAISGIFASLTIPSALNLITKLFPDPLEQSRAISIFGSSGAIGNILGLLIGAILVQFADWQWVFWFAAIVALPVATISVILIPAKTGHDDDLRQESPSKSTKMHGLDLIGVSSLTMSFILFIFAMTEGSAAGWGSAMVLAPLVISVFLVTAFLYYETYIPEDRAAVPPKTWSYPNFPVLFATALLPFFWWTTDFLVYTTYWQDVFHWSAIGTAVHMFPIGVMAFVIGFTGPLSHRMSPKWLILLGECLLVVATALFPFAEKPESYWPIIFPAFAIGSSGCMLVFTHTNIAIFRATPPHMAGTVGAIFNSALQLGAAAGSAIVSSIQTSVQNGDGIDGGMKYKGRAAAFWFLFAVVCIELVVMAIFYDPSIGKFDDIDEKDRGSQSFSTSEKVNPEGKGDTSSAV